MGYQKDWKGPGAWRLEESEIMDKLDRRVCMQIGTCSPEKLQRGCAFCADIVDDIIESYFRLKAAQIDYRTPTISKVQEDE